MKWISYLLWRFVKADNEYETIQGKKLHGLIPLSGLMIIHLLSIIFLLSTILNNDWYNLGLFSNGDGYFTRKGKSILLAFPVFLVLFIIFFLRSKRVNTYFELFENMNDTQKKKYNRGYIIYWIVALLVFFGSIISAATRYGGKS